MTFSKEQYKEYYEAHKSKLNQQRAERRRLKRLGQVGTLKEVGTLQKEIGLGQVETTDKIIEVGTLNQVGTAQEQKWSFELFLEKQGYTNPNNPIYFSPEKIKEMKNHSINYWKEKNPYYYENTRKTTTTTPN